MRLELDHRGLECQARFLNIVYREQRATEGFSDFPYRVYWLEDIQTVCVKW